MRSTVVILLFIFFLSGCTPERSQSEQTVALEVDASKFTYFFDLTMADNTTGTYIGASNQDITFSKSKNGVSIENAGIEVGSSAGTTDGFYLALGKDFESKLSGSMIRVTIFAKTINKGGMAVAYSTANVGNSGWKIFTLEKEVAEYSFDYNVPAMINAGIDFIGVVPTSEPITVSSIAITIL